MSSLAANATTADAGPAVARTASLQLVDERRVLREVNQLLQRAGLERRSDGTVVVRDTPANATAVAANGLSANEQVRSVQEAQLPPPAPPRLPLTRELIAGAEGFALNLDRAMDSAFLRPEAAAARATAGVTRPSWASPASRSASPIDPQNLVQVKDLNPDVLLAAFLKLNITDPNNSVETHNKLYELASRMRQLSIDEAKARIKRAEEMRKEAEEYAKKVEALSQMLMIVQILLAIISFGVGAALTAIVQAAISILKAAAEKTAAEMMCDAQQMANLAKASRAFADQHQDQIQNESAALQMIMESKNQAVDAVMKMMAVNFSSSQKLLSAAMAKG